MGETHTVRSVSELNALIRKHLRQRETKVRAAARRAAARGRAVLKKGVPVAFGEIRESVHTEGQIIVIDAPHAAAVNNGSRPHMPPLEPLVAWVKLRGMQGLGTDRQIGRLPGTTTAASARGVASLLRAHERQDTGGAYSPTDAAIQVARAIQMAIAKRGTKPAHFVEKALPELRAILGEELRAALSDGGGDGGDGGGGGKRGKTTASGAYRKHADTYRGAKIQTSPQGHRYVRLKNGKTIFLKH